MSAKMNAPPLEQHDTQLKNAADDLIHRCPVWDVMSKLFLDTELQADDHERIAGVLGSSPYDAADLDRIMFRAVYPVLIANLWSLAGTWSDFDSDLLHAAILKRLSRRFRLPAVCIPGWWLVRRDWRNVKLRAVNGVRWRSP